MVEKAWWEKGDLRPGGNTMAMVCMGPIQGQGHSSRDGSGNGWRWGSGKLAFVAVGVASSLSLEACNLWNRMEQSWIILGASCEEIFEDEYL